MIDAKLNFYEILGVKRNASQKTIWTAYREKAKQNHPDKNPGDETAKARFQNVQLAIEVLGNKERKERYDATGEYAASPRPEDQLEGRALKAVSTLFHETIISLVSVGQCPERIDLIQRMAKSFDAKIREANGNLSRMQKLIDALTVIAGRITTEEHQDNVMSSMARAPIDDLNKQIAQTQDSIKVDEAALAIVRKHKFDPLNPPTSGNATQKTPFFSFVNVV